MKKSITNDSFEVVKLLETVCRDDDVQTASANQFVGYTPPRKRKHAKTFLYCSTSLAESNVKRTRVKNGPGIQSVAVCGEGGAQTHADFTMSLTESEVHKTPVNTCSGIQSVAAFGESDAQNTVDCTTNLGGSKLQKTIIKNC